MSINLSLTGLLLVTLLASVAPVRSTTAEEPGTLYHGFREVPKGLPESKPDSVPASRPQKLWEAFRKSQQEPAESFEEAALAIVKSRKLLGLTRKEVEAKLGEPSSADWFVHMSKPRFMGDRVRYTREGPKADEYLSLGLFFKNGKVYACYFGVFDRVTGKVVEKYHQESVGKPIRLTIN
jgi:hypothetical protein